MPELASDPAALLDLAEQAHRGGRFAQVRSLLAQLAGQTLAPAEQQRATALRDRLRPDRLVAILIAVCLLLFVAIIRSTWR